MHRRIAILLVFVLAAACAPEPEPAEPAQRYDLRGVVVSANPDSGTVTIEHEPVEDFMGAMTMPFNVRDAWVFEAVEPGATITAELVVQGASSWLESIVVVRSAAAGTAAEAVVALPDAGAEAPSVALVNQDGVEFQLGDLRGRWVALTFIYTRCPLPDFCPRMSQHFLELYRAVEAEPEAHGDAVLLSVTVDPDYDTPEVLTEYGRRYVEDFERWWFVRAEKEPLGELALFSGLRFQPENGEVLHSLRTLVIDPDGRVADRFVGNSWSAYALTKALREAVEARGEEP